MPGRRQTSWRALTATGVAVAVLAVGGCSTQSRIERIDSPPPRPSTPTPTSTAVAVTLPEQPAAMAEPTTDGAIAAATYVLDLYTYAYASGDTEPWDAITLDSCTFCDGVAESVNEMVAAGHSSSGGPFTVEKAQAVEISEDRWFSVDMEASQAPSTAVDSSGATVSEHAGGRYSVVFALSWDQAWRVDQMGFEFLNETTAAQP